jgi:hypothetical protein
MIRYKNILPPRSVFILLLVCTLHLGMAQPTPHHKLSDAELITIRDGFDQRVADAFNADCSRSPEIDGKPVDYAPAKAFDSPFLQSDWNSGVVHIQTEHRAVYGFR